MGHKTITISDQAYCSLVKLKLENESFTEAILRLTSRHDSARSLLEFLEKLPVSEELARNVEIASKRMRAVR
jgi:predicted CopG family antitoxin